MPKTFKTSYLFATRQETKVLKSAAKKCSPEFTIKFHKRNSTVEVEYEGEGFQGFKTYCKNFCDTIILDPQKHSSIKIDDLRILGVSIKIEGPPVLSYNPYYALTNIDCSKHFISFSPDLRDEPILVRTFVDYRNLKINSGIDSDNHQRAHNYISKYKDINILHDGIMDDDYYQTLIDSYKKHNLPFLSTLTKYWPIIVELEFGFPSTVGDLIRRVDAFKKGVINNA